MQPDKPFPENASPDARGEDALQLYELASLIRSKNAGPFTLTFDVLFADEEAFERVKQSGALTAETFARLYGVSHNQVRFFTCDNAKAFKISIPRPHPAGDPADADLHGGQQHAPLMAIEVA
jgi:hypothetical protein